jgi:hypothetical protein
MQEEEHIATLVHDDEYSRNAGQMAKIYSTRLLFVKRKELALKPYELVELPLEQCTSISYEVKWAIVPMIFGMLLVAVVGFILTSYIEPGTRVPVGALAIVLIFGVILARGPKRHRLTFIVGGKRYRWQSKAGDFKYKIASVRKLVSFAREKGLLVSDERVGIGI